MQHEAQERLQQLEEEERQAEEKYRAGLDLEEGEAIPDRAARRSLEQQRLQQSHGPWEEMEKSYHNEGNAPGPAANVAGLISDGHRKQLREVELRVRLAMDLSQACTWSNFSRSQTAAYL